MDRQIKEFAFPEGQLQEIKRRMLYWADQYNILLFLDNNNYQAQQGAYECLLAADPIALVTEDPELPDRGLGQLEQFRGDWLFGHLAYDLQHHSLRSLSRHRARHGFPGFFFFRPGIVCSIRRDCAILRIESSSCPPEHIWQAICALPPASSAALPRLQFSKRIGKTEYLQLINTLKTHIRDGDCYELNFCNEAYCTDALIDPLPVFDRLNGLSPAPFAAYYRNKEQHVLCASPERFLRREGSTLTAQPIKGTARRNLNDPAADERLKQQLQHSIKERAENVMIVDLMRNDLARCCNTGSIEVPELFGIYSFPQVHQMISTICGTLKPDIGIAAIMAYCFPMGSMTGAPKQIVMSLIDRYEAAARELFSGSIGYISPDGDFDFNVVIRSLFYNAASRYLSYQTGGAITYESDPEQEWAETLLKASAIEQLFLG